MDAPCEIQRSIHVFRLVNNMCPGKWVHITCLALFSFYLDHSSIQDLITLIAFLSILIRITGF